MIAEDDDEGEGGIGTTRYPCMPSLVALQQMRNRLHLAYLGKKLMKWTAMATGRELRRIAFDLTESYTDFSEDLSDAYMLLARCRYFHLDLNKMVLENVGQKASVLVALTVKTVSGVKVYELGVVESGVDPYPYLGIEKGGQTILQAKKAWLDILKRMVIMLQLRESFLSVDMANKAATKKMNVMSKIVIPQTAASIAYILSELEEKEREEFFRLKKILEVKLKRKMQLQKDAGRCDHGKPIAECPVCGKDIKKEEPILLDVVEFCIICGVSLVDTEKTEEEENQEQIEEYRSKLAEMVSATKLIDEQGLVGEDIEDFLKTAESLQKTLDDKTGKPFEPRELKPIPSDVNVSFLCSKCRDRFEKEISQRQHEDKGMPEEPGRPGRDSSRATMKSVRIDDQTELGTFETDTKQITKIVRKKNPDGTITEEKKTVKIKKEVRAPAKTGGGKTNDVNYSDTGRGNVMYEASEASAKSNPYPDSRTIGMMTENTQFIGTNLKLDEQRKAKSEIYKRPEAMGSPTARYCISSSSVTTVDDSLQEILNFVSGQKSEAPSCMLRGVTHSFASLLGDMPSTSTKYEYSSNSLLTNSEVYLLLLIDGPTDIKQPQSKSETVFTKDAIKRDTVGHSQSFINNFIDDSKQQQYQSAIITS